MSGVQVTSLLVSHFQSLLKVHEGCSSSSHCICIPMCQSAFSATKSTKGQLQRRRGFLGLSVRGNLPLPLVPMVGHGVCVVKLLRSPKSGSENRAGRGGTRSQSPFGGYTPSLLSLPVLRVLPVPVTPPYQDGI